MRYRSALVACVVVLGMLAAALPVAAQEAGEPITWVISVTVKPGKFPELEKATETYDKPVFDRLVANGTIMSWGFGRQVIGPPSESGTYWVTAADWTAMGKVDKAFEDNYKSMKPEDAKEAMTAFYGATVPEKESSSVVRHVVFKGTPGGSVNYLARHVYKIKSGKGQAAMKTWKEYNAPVYDKLLAAGVISGYGAAVPEYHDGSGWTHTFWYSFSEMSQIDAMDKAFEEADKARGETINETLMSNWTQMHDMDAHWDSLMKVSMYGGAAM